MKKFALVVGLAALALGACTNEQVYNFANGWKTENCYQKIDPALRDKCLRTAGASYKDFKKLQDSGSKRDPAQAEINLP